MSPHPDMLPGPLALSRNDLAFPADAAEEAAAAVVAERAVFAQILPAAGTP